MHRLKYFGEKMYKMLTSSFISSSSLVYGEAAPLNKSVLLNPLLIGKPNCRTDLPPYDVTSASKLEHSLNKKYASFSILF